MILAHDRSNTFGQLLDAIKVSAFFGVPHRGADAAYWATFAATLLEVGQFGFGTNKNFVQSLQRNCPLFAEISREFVERAANLKKIGTFYETEKLLNQLVRPYVQWQMKEFY